MIQACSPSYLNWELSKFAVAETLPAEDIMDTWVKIGGNVTEDGGASVFEKGFCVATTASPTTNGRKIKCGDGLGSFKAKIDSLLPKTTYHLRAFATNEVGTAYGNEVILVTIGQAGFGNTTIASIGLNSAIANGNIASDGGADVTERGFCYGTATLPTTQNSKAAAGSGTGIFSATLSQLTANTTYFIRAYAINKAGTAYGNEVTFHTASLPTLTTQEAQQITPTAAVCGGDITDMGSATVKQRGICYSLSHNPSLSDMTISNGTGTGTFQVTISGLLPKTVYYARGYATNNFGTSYGNEITFTTLPVQTPTLTTTEATAITTTTASSGGTISYDGGNAVTVRGVCYGTEAAPTVSGSQVVETGSGTGTFKSTLTGLKASTFYYARAYATNSAGTGYGNEIRFTAADVVPATVSTGTITNITTTTASAAGSVSYDGGGPVSEKGICFSTAPLPTLNDGKVPGTAGTGSFTLNLKALAPDTKYYLRAYAINAAGTSYGSEINFTTNAVVPATLTTTVASAITLTGASTGGTITSDGGGTITSRGICYGLSASPTFSDNTITSGTGTGNFRITLTGLTPGTAYHVRAFATNSAGTVYGNEIIFTTIPIVIPTIGTSSLSTITAYSVNASCTTALDGGAAITEKGFCYGTAPGPTIADNRQTGGSGTSGYALTLRGLAENTHYYIRAYATNSAGTAYGNEMEFTTESAKYIGQSWQGGTIFYVDPASGIHGLIAATADLSSTASWGCEGTMLSNCSATALNKGATNTDAIVMGCQTSGIAAASCANLVLNGYSDWYLPSKDELNQVYLNLKAHANGNFVAGKYWSSSQYTVSASWAISFQTGSFNAEPKSSAINVRPVRSF